MNVPSDKKPFAVELAQRALPAIGSAAGAITGNTAIAPIVSSVVLLTWLGASAFGWAGERRVKRVLLALAREPALSWHEVLLRNRKPYDAERVRRELRNLLNEIQNAFDDGVVDALAELVRVRLRDEESTEFIRDTASMIRQLSTEQLHEAVFLLRDGLAASPDPVVKFWDNRRFPNSERIVMAVSNDGTQTPFHLRREFKHGRRIFRLLKAAELAADVSTNTGTYVYSGEFNESEGPDASMMITRRNAARVLRILDIK